MAGGWRGRPHVAGARRFRPCRGLRAGPVLAVLLLGPAAGCAPAEVADTPSVLLAEGTAGDQPWRLQGRRLGGMPCLSLLVDQDQETAGHCGIRRSPLRHLIPAAAPVGPRLLVFSALPASARRVRLDLADSTIRVDPARTAPGFPGRFFVVDLDPEATHVAVRAFADGGRAVVT